MQLASLDESIVYSIATSRDNPWEFFYSYHQQGTEEC